MSDVVTMVVDRVQAVTGDELEELPPLHDTVDADAVSTLAGDGVWIQFEYARCLVTIEDGAVSVQEQDGSAGDA